MPEATIIILDNSEYSINGDYEPTRWICQIDAAGLLIQAKLELHHQNIMGIALSAGKHAEIVCTPTNPSEKVSSYLYGLKQYGRQQLSVALQTCALALKHRSDQSLTKRIILFVASTIEDNPEQLKLICKKMKKNNIALDIIALGDLSPQQKDTLTAMHEAIKGQGNMTSNILFVEPKDNFSDIIFNSNITGYSQGQHGAPGVNEAEDPELLMALQLSIREEEERQAARRAAATGNEDAELEQRALQMAMEEQEGKEKDSKEDKKEQ